jgi:3-oxoacyl-[acyl-carrier protein] reductase
MERLKAVFCKTWSKCFYIQFICWISFALEMNWTLLGIKAKGYQSNAADFNEARYGWCCIAEFGTADLINNAWNYKDNCLMRMSEEDFDKVIDVNLKSVLIWPKRFKERS